MSIKQLKPTDALNFSKRLCTIIQLCLSFSLIFWYVGQPFMGEYFRLKSRLLLYEYVLGTSEILSSSHLEKLGRNQKRFASLPEELKQQLAQTYQKLYDYATRPSLVKIKEGIKSLLLDVPAFEQAWIFFAIIIAIFILLRIEGARQASWLLPLIALAYGIDNHFHKVPLMQEADQALFPPESFIQQEYVKETLSPNLSEQRKQLQQGWESYLIQHWTQTSSIQNKELQLEEAEFNFTLARLIRLQAQPLPNHLSLFHQREPFFLLILYVVWNLFFAWIVNRNVKVHFVQCHAYEAIQ